jgi:hypothetical protein
VTNTGSDSPTILGISGGGGLDLFPVSRFPFGASYNASSSSVSGAAGGTDIFFQRLSLTQGYRPPDNAYSANARYDWSGFNTAQSGNDTIHTVSGNFTMPIKTENPQNFTSHGTYTINNNSKGISGSNLLNLQATHNINVIDYGLLLNTDASFSDNQITTSGASNQTQSFQIGSSADWIPDDDIPLRVFGTGRYFQQTAGGFSSTALSLNSSATYTYNRNWSFGANAGLINTSFSGRNVTTMFGGLNAAWSGNGITRQFGNWLYNMGYGANAGLNTTTGETSGQTSMTVGGNVGQGISRTVDLGLPTPVGLSLSQGYGASFSQASGVSQNLTHGVTANWAFSQGSDYTLSANVSGNDSRSFGASESSFQNISSMVVGNLVLGPYSSMTASVNAGLSSQSSTQQGTVVPADWIGSASGSVGYRHARFMRVPGLLYDASYIVNYRPTTSRLLGDTSASSPGLNLDHIFRQQWQWRVGQLSLTVNNSVTFSAGARSMSIFLFATRTFGGVL